MVLTCREISERLDSYVAQALEAREMFAVRAHLRTCSECRRRLAEAKALQRALRHGGIVVPPPGYLEALPDRLLHRIESETAHERTTPPRWTFGFSTLVAAALVLVVWQGLLWFRGLPGGLSDSGAHVRASLRVALGESPSIVPTARVTPRAGRRELKRGDVIEVQLIRVEPRTVLTTASGPIVFEPGALSAIESPPVENETEALSMAWANIPAHDRTTAAWESEALAFSPAPSDATTWIRQGGVSVRPADIYGLAFVFGRTEMVADVTLPPDSEGGRTR